MPSSSIPWRAVLCHPVWILVGLVPLSQWAQDNGFPISNFPMYARNDRSSHLVYLADGAGTPISLVRHTSMSCARVTKLHRAILQQECRRRRIKISTAPLNVHEAVGTQLLDQLRRIGKDHSCEPMPEGAGVVFLDLEFDGSRIHQDPIRLTKP